MSCFVCPNLHKLCEPGEAANHTILLHSHRAQPTKVPHSLGQNDWSRGRPIKILLGILFV